MKHNGFQVCILASSEREIMNDFFDFFDENELIIYVIINKNVIKLLSKDEFINIESKKIIKIDENTLVIRWGSRAVVNTGKNHVLNRSKNIKKASNKKESRILMDSNRIRIPEMIYSIEDSNIVSYPVIIRPLHHERGNNFFIANNPKHFLIILNKHFNGNLENCYATSYFDKTNEYRVYCADNKILYFQEKIGVQNVKLSNIKDVNDLDWMTLNWNKLKSEPYKKICLESLKATKLHNLNFAAVDVLYNGKNDSFVICEVNTAPELLDYGFQRFSKYFKSVCNNNKIDDIDENNFLWENNFTLKKEKNGKN